MNLQTRNFKQADVKDLYRFTYQAWYQETGEKFPTETEAVTWIDVYSSLNSASYGQVVEIHGQVAGIILADVFNHEKSLRLFQGDQSTHFQKLLAGDPDYQKLYIHQTNQTNHSNQKLLESSNVDYQAEILLFIVDPKFQGQGVGTKLYETCLNHLKDSGVQHFYLYTDTFCNYPFYDKRGLRQVGRLPFLGELTNNHEQDHYYFMYDNVQK